MMKHDFIKCGNTVVVKKDGHERLSRVKAVFDDTVIVEAIEYPLYCSFGGDLDHYALGCDT